MKRWQWGGKRWDAWVALAIRHQWRSVRGQPPPVMWLEQVDGRLSLVVRR